MIIQQENITFVNVYVPNIGAPKFRKQILTSKETDNNTVKVKNSATPLTASRQKSQ